MKKLFLSILLVVCCTTLCVAQEWDPVPNEEAVVESGRARFTVLTPEIIRIQYSARKKFEDRASFAVVNRKLDVPAFTTEEADGYLYIRTEKVTLKYKVGSAISASLNDPQNLSVTFTMNGKEKLWYPGKDDALNLLGTSRTLDGDIGDTHRVELEKGLLSRDGWVVLDESPSAVRGDGSKSYVFDDECDGIPWFDKPVDTTALDWYFMAYGHDYKRALGDYVKLAGRQPLPPLYMFGYWYSKYQAYTATQFQQLAREMEKNDVPHDVMIFDMDWHKAGWTGWTWNNSLIPDPKGLISWMHNHNLKVALNLHPADGVDSDEDGYSAMQQATGLSGDVPWMIENKAFTSALFKNIIRKRESEGVDFWWIDWQQKKTVGEHAQERGYACPAGVEGLGETFWINHVFYNDMRLNRTDRRPVIFHRWGGMGSHRYPIGFSGDTYATYGTLAFEPYYTATASNVCFGYWGHDIGAHLLIGDSEKVDPEMYLRWLQYGVFSPLLRTHASSQGNNERRIWKFDNFDLMNKAVKLRYALVPYIYTCAREAYDTGVSICRPLYYEWPEDNRSYSNESEYMFGNDILVAPIAEATGADGKVDRKIWLPEGHWYDVCRGRLLSGDMEFTDSYTAEEIPYFIRQGSIIPCYPDIDHLKESVPTVVLKVVPGRDGTGVMYEDDGDSDSYQNGAFSTTTFAQQRTDDFVMLIISHRVGAFPGQLAERAYQVEFLSEGMPEKILIDGQETDSWTYDEAARSVVVNVPSISVDKGAQVMLIRQTDGIKQPEITDDGEKYNTAGLKVTDSYQGVIIRNKKKYLRK